MDHPGWEVSVHALPCPDPDRLAPDQHEQFTRYRAVWEQYVAPFTPSSGDFEDWVEQAARLDAALRVFGAGHCWIRVHRPGWGAAESTGRAENAATGEAHPDPARLALWGAQTSNLCHEADHVVDQETRAGRYATTAAFARYNRRSAQIVPGSLYALEGAVQAAWARGHKAVWVKVNRTKYGLARLRAPEARRGLGGLAGLVSDDPGGVDLLFGAAAHLEGDPDAFLVYPEAVMHYEYRLFVVDGRPVTGAGCVEHHTPLDNEGPFDPKMVKVRGAGPVERRPDLAAQFAAFGQQVAAALLEEGLLHYTLDVAATTRGTLMIECNGILNSGLYATDPALVTAALAASEHPMVAAPVHPWGRAAV